MIIQVAPGTPDGKSRSFAIVGTVEVSEGKATFTSLVDYEAFSIRLDGEEQIVIRECSAKVGEAP